MSTASDLHGKRANRAAGARPVRDFINADGLPKRRVPGALASATFTHRVGVKPDHGDPVIEHAHRAFNGMGRVLEDLHKRERAIRADRSKTREAHNLRVAQMVDKHLTAPSDGVEAARGALRASIEEIDREVERSFRNQMSREDAAELRQTLRTMTPQKRSAYFTEAMKSGDFSPIAAALAHPSAVVSGMSKAERVKLRTQYEQALHGEQIERRARLERAAEQLETGWEIYFAEVTGLRDAGVDALEQAARAAEDAVNRPIVDEEDD
ncbi:hypothetical protein [Roseovarius sp.]|uniref:hypothetical protein n=1 Tax=Roseovarius sp. TaxID=1486281 RepID=UPI00261D6D68|nr:hypothetical protein [Roseovarius sp.]MDM8167013.1 hypothetical protein [Roseovarius sp.]